jgi:hypothetical protein
MTEYDRVKILRARLFTENTLKSISVVMVCLAAYVYRTATKDCEPIKSQKTIINLLFSVRHNNIFFFKLLATNFTVSPCISIHYV